MEILLALLLTAISYMAFPLIRLIINKGKFSNKRAKKIALWNSVVVGLIFLVLTIELTDGNATWNAAPAFLYYAINFAILRNQNKDEDLANKYNEDVSQNNNAIFCNKCGNKLPCNALFCTKCGTKRNSD